MFFDDSLADGKAETGSRVPAFGRKEWIENVGDDLFGNADAVVFYGDFYPSWFGGVFLGFEANLRILPAGGLSCVDDQVDQDLLYFSGVHRNRWEVVFHFHFESFYLFLDLFSYKGDNVIHHFPNASREAFLGVVATDVIFKIRNDTGDTLRAVLHVVQQLEYVVEEGFVRHVEDFQTGNALGFTVENRPDSFDVPFENRQVDVNEIVGVIDLVGDTRNDLPQRGQFLSTENLFFGPFGFGEIQKRSDSLPRSRNGAQCHDPVVLFAVPAKEPCFVVFRG